MTKVRITVIPVTRGPSTLVVAPHIFPKKRVMLHGQLGRLGWVIGRAHEVTMSRKAPKKQLYGLKLRSTRTKAGTRAGRMRETRAELERGPQMYCDQIKGERQARYARIVVEYDEKKVWILIPFPEAR